MSMITEFVKELREKSALFSKSDFAVAGIAKDYKEAADIIEELSVKLASENMERSEQYYKDVPDTNAVKNLSENLIKTMKFAIEASNANDDYTTGLRNGMRYCLSLIDGKEPKFESCKQDWIPCEERLPDDFMSYEYLTIRKGQTLATITHYCVVNHKWYSNRKSIKEIDVVAWQPLPQPYKGE